MLYFDLQERINLLNDNPEMKIDNIDTVNFLQFSYLRHGLYALNLENWFKIFEKNQFRHFSTEALDKDYSEIMNSLFTFFGIKKIKLQKEERKNIGIGMGPYDPMKEKTRNFLLDFYKPHNSNLYKLLGKKFDWDV